MTISSRSIAVAATMSAGKSSLINALIGKELLHSANEATTAKIARVFCSRRGAKAVGYCAKSKVAQVNPQACPDQLREWNQSDEISAIDITVSTSKILAGHTIYDTPGANNSMDSRHYEIFMAAMQGNRYGTLLYVLNASQLGTRDDAEVLSAIRELNPALRVVFALNKIDVLDEELGESVADYVNSAMNYLLDLGFERPIIVPVMARSALSAKKLIRGLAQGRRERSEFGNELERFRENPSRLIDAAHMPYAVKRRLRRRVSRKTHPTIDKSTNVSHKELKVFIDYSGLTALELLITQTA